MLLKLIMFAALLAGLAYGAMEVGGWWGALGIIMVASCFTAGVIGLLTRQRAEAVRALLLQCGALLGLVGGVVGVWFLPWTVAGYQASWSNFIYGALAGALLGMGVVMLLDMLIQRIGSAARR